MRASQSERCAINLSLTQALLTELSSGRLLQNHHSHRQTFVQRNSRTYVLPQGTASISTKLTRESDNNAAYGDMLSFSARLEYLPSSNLAQAKIVANVLHYSGYFGSTTLYPSLSVSPVIPLTSEVFVTIESGDLTKLQTLLRAGSASLRDCDPEGRSLLGVRTTLPKCISNLRGYADGSQYACFNDKPEICKYLLEHGADEDATEKANYGDPNPEYFSSHMLRSHVDIV